MNNGITDSEWKVMLVLWSSEPLRYSEVLKRVLARNDWSESTVKTLISRLMSKNKIEVTRENNKKLYQAKVFEIDEMRKKIQNQYISLYTNKVNKDTKYFSFYGQDDSDKIDILSKDLDKIYIEFCEKLKLKPIDPNPVIIHYSQRAFKSSVGLMNGPDWIRSGWSWGIIHIAPYDDALDIDFKGTFLHSVFQSTLEILFLDLPNWFLVGLAFHESKWLSRNEIKTYVNKEKLHIFKVENFNEIKLNFSTSSIMNTFIVSYTIIDFLIVTKGIEFIVDIIHGRIFIDYLTLVEDWKEYLRKEYLR